MRDASEIVIAYTERTEDEVMRDIHRSAGELRLLRPRALPEIVEREEHRLERLWEELRAARCFRRTHGAGFQIEPLDLRRNGRGR